MGILEISVDDEAIAAETVLEWLKLVLWDVFDPVVDLRYLQINGDHTTHWRLIICLKDKVLLVVVNILEAADPVWYNRFELKINIPVLVDAAFNVSDGDKLDVICVLMGAYDEVLTIICHLRYEHPVRLVFVLVDKLILTLVCAHMMVVKLLVLELLRLLRCLI